MSFAISAWISNPNSRFIRFKGITTSSTICCMETKSLQHSHGRNVNSLGTGSLICMSLIFSNLLRTEQNATRPSTHSNIDNTLLTNIVVISRSVTNANKEANSNTKFNQTFSRSKREFPSISVEQNSYVSGMAGFWKGLFLQQFLRKQPSLYSSQEGKVLLEITNLPGRSGVAGVTHGKLTYFDALWIMF